jgi:hypothetical protein
LSIDDFTLARIFHEWSGLSVSVPAQEAIARQALTVTLRPAPINAELFESSMFSVWEAGTYELFGPE